MWNLGGVLGYIQEGGVEVTNEERAMVGLPPLEAQLSIDAANNASLQAQALASPQLAPSQSPAASVANQTENAAAQAAPGILDRVTASIAGAATGQLIGAGAVAAVAYITRKLWLPFVGGR